ncbi:MAG: hypothetical protein KGI58_03335 [Patescibacteria group bacterium]|nr:hypothetical protein [Patescibacteria group bacterium]
MEPQLVNLPPVPLPQNSSSQLKEFHKSTIVFILACVQLGFYVYTLITLRVNEYFPPVLLLPSFLFLIPSLLIVFTKNKSVYKFAKVIIIMEYIASLPLIISFIFGI